MNILQAIVLGLVQGLTEFIPVSSSGHLVIAHQVLGVTESGLAFDVALHFGTLIALVVFFWKDLLLYAQALVKKNKHTRLTYLLIAATIPAAVFGYVLESKAESTFRSVRLVACTMLIFGVFMLLAEYYYQRTRTQTNLNHITNHQALAMGVAQAIAIIPGVSRSGSTITAGIFMGLDRVAATRFSFLLGIPIMVGAVLKVFSEGDVLRVALDEKTIFLTGMLTALISGWSAIRFMLKFVAHHGLHAFAYYRIGLGLLLLLVFTV